MKKGIHQNLKTVFTESKISCNIDLPKTEILTLQCQADWEGISIFHGELFDIYQ